LKTRPVFINGLGCFESGARGVLRELMKAFPSGQPAVLVLPACNRDDVREISPDVRVVALNHTVFGRWLRPLFEVLVWCLGKLGAFSRIVNLSHYGLCPGGRYTLYFHNQLLIETGHDAWSGQGGRPNGFKRWCLHSCLRRAEKVVVQSERMQTQLLAYAAARGLAPVVEVVFPFPRISTEGPAAARKFEFQFFYPASVFPHKRVGLAAAGVRVAQARDQRVGLVVTVAPPPEERAACIEYLGTVAYADVLAWFASSDALLFTSTHETLGLPLLEALQFGLPAVLPDETYARNLYGDAAVYFQGDSAEAVGEAIRDCMQRRDELAARARRRATELAGKGVRWEEHWTRFGVLAREGAGRS
jgi:glycosyltransferase involved in cell wall biosynthesis